MAPASSKYPKSRRLLKGSQFRTVFRDHTRSRDACVGVFARANGLPHARLGIAVSRRVSPRSTVRNRIRRQIRESFRRHQHQLTGLDVVVVAQAGCAERGNRALCDSLARHWRRIVRQCESSSPP